MAIILEGFDNSGKSTLAQAFGLTVLHPGPKPKSRAEEFRCLEEQQREARNPVVMDRVTCISSQVYADRMFEPMLKMALLEMLDTQHCILIYCRPPIARITDFSGHVAKGYDKSSNLRWLENNAVRLVGQYDKLMKDLPHMRYDWTQPQQGLIDEALNAQFSHGAWKRCKEMMLNVK